MIFLQPNCFPTKECIYSRRKRSAVVKRKTIILIFDADININAEILGVVDDDFKSFYEL